MTLFSPASLKLSPSEETQTVDSEHSTGFQSKVNPDMIAIWHRQYVDDVVTSQMQWHSINVSSHDSDTTKPWDHSGFFGRRSSMKYDRCFFYDIPTTMFVALSPLWWKIFFSGQYQVRLHSNCVYSKIGLFLEALKQQRRMSITIQSITSLIRNGPSLWCISKPVHICSPGVCKVLLRHLYHDPLYHSHQMHIFWNR